MAQALEALFHVGRVDLVLLSEAETFLAADAVRGELLWSSSGEEESEAQLYYLRRAADLAPFLREQWRERVGGEL